MKKMSSSLKILQQLYFLRNFTIAFVIFMMILAVYGLDLPLPVEALGLTLLVMAVVNAYTLWMIRSDHAITDKLLFVQLLFEMLSFAVILYFSGGATNPFTFYFLIPIAIAATVIPGKRAWLLMGVSVVIYSVLLKYYQPLSYEVHAHQQHDMSMGGMFSQHVLGMWFGFLVSSFLVTWFITRLAHELKSRDEAIALAHENELRYQQMVTLGTLAAGTAHELGSPLASLAIVNGEITSGFSKEEQPELFEHQRIMREQIKRCKSILSVLSDTAGESRADEGFLIKVEDYVLQTVAEWHQINSDFECGVVVNGEIKGSILSDKTLSQALINLLNNALDASDENIRLTVSMLDKSTLSLAIDDRGVGMSDEQIALAGDVSFSTKPDGLGIGLFLALTTIRRYGGGVNFKRLEQCGTRTEIMLPVILNHDE